MENNQSERDFFIGLMKKRDAEKKAGVTPVYLPAAVDTGFLSRDHSGTISVWCDRREQNINIDGLDLETLLWRHKFLNRRIIDVKTQSAIFVWKYRAWHGIYAGRPCRKMQVSVHRILEHGFSGRVYKCILVEGKCRNSICAPDCRKLYWNF